MRRSLVLPVFGSIAIGASALTLQAQAAATKIDTTAFTVVSVSPKDGPLPTLLAREIKKAETQHRAPVVEFWAPWCPHCKSLEAGWADSRMVDAFRGIYVIRLNFDEWKPTLKETKFTLANGIPAFYALGHDSTTTGETIDGGAWGDDTPENMAPPLKQYFTSVIQHFNKATTAPPTRRDQQE